MNSFRVKLSVMTLIELSFCLQLTFYSARDAAKERYAAHQDRHEYADVVELKCDRGEPDCDRCQASNVQCRYPERRKARGAR
jgi:hypothetical protein